MSKMKTAFGISFFSALAAFLLALDQTLAVAAVRALMVFGCIFLLSFIGCLLMSKILPRGSQVFDSPGPRPEGKGEERFVDMEKHSVDLSKLQDMMR